jgi:hypothetical protein
MVAAEPEDLMTALRDSVVVARIDRIKRTTYAGDNQSNRERDIWFLIETLEQVTAENKRMQEQIGGLVEEWSDPGETLRRVGTYGDGLMSAADTLRTVLAGSVAATESED